MCLPSSHTKTSSWRSKGKQGNPTRPIHILMIGVIVPLSCEIIIFCFRLYLVWLFVRSGTLLLACSFTLRFRSHHRACERTPDHVVGRHSKALLQYTYSRSVCHIGCSVQRSFRPLRVQRQRHSFRMTESTFSLSDSWLHKSRFAATPLGSSSTNPSTWICLKRKGMEHGALQ